MVYVLWLVGWLVIWLCVCDYAGVLLAMTTMTDDDNNYYNNNVLCVPIEHTHTHIVLL